MLKYQHYETTVTKYYDMLNRCLQVFSMSVKLYRIDLSDILGYVRCLALKTLVLSQRSKL